MLGGFEVFDCHHHVGDAAQVMGIHGQPDDTMTPEQELAKRLKVMDRDGVDCAVVIPGHGYYRPEGLADTRRINDHIAAYRNAHRDRFPVAVGVAEPAYGPASLAEIDRMADELQINGISFHVRFQGVSLDNLWIKKYVERMLEKGMVPVIHAVHETSENPLWKVASLGRAFPDSPMLVLDAFGSHEGTKETFFTAELAPNLLFDTSLAVSFGRIKAFTREFGAERVVFGTDLYSWPLGRQTSPLAKQFAGCDLPDEQKRLVLAGNVRRLFKLPAR